MGRKRKIAKETGARDRRAELVEEIGVEESELEREDGEARESLGVKDMTGKCSPFYQQHSVIMPKSQSSE